MALFEIVDEGNGGTRTSFCGTTGTLRGTDYVEVFIADHTSHAPVERFGSGLIAGLCACAITQPFDMIKTHVQLFSQHSLYEFISLLYQQGGVLAFFRGFWLRATRRALMAALSWTFFDEVCSYCKYQVFVV
ncbi:unnamed protein product [Gongylonema pulchrum]|uniref:Solute carrier family 25 member 45 n=1 Tax=Gongylonema pulchrum TaxID=637853 RepID=A0A3P7M3D3_9BILA|nr:unnamed protein product [Gongylonema pulchrum]